MPLIEALELAKIESIPQHLSKEYFLAASKGLRVGLNKLKEKENQS